MGHSPRSTSVTAVFLYLCTLILLHADAQYLSVVNNELRLGNQKIFLSGVNLAWHSYGNDFGNNRYTGAAKATLEDYLKRIHDNGGNSIRLWLHCGGAATPDFNWDGYAFKSDAAETMAGDLGKFLDKAREYHIIVFIVLWNGAVNGTQNMINLIWDDSKLSTYMNKVLTPLVTALKTKEALGGWEIINEPEAMIYNNLHNNNPCFDTLPLAGSGAGWTNLYIPMRLMLRFINRQIAAIKAADGKALTTVGSWSELSQTDIHMYRNYYTDACLRAAGGEVQGTIDIHQMHTYATRPGPSFNSYSPLKRPNSVYCLTKPNIIGEFSQSGGDGRDITAYMDHAYCNGYSGAWTWQANEWGQHADSFNTQARGLLHLRNRTDISKGGIVALHSLYRIRPIQRQKTRTLGNPI